MCMQQVWGRGAVPLIVGGSGFYVNSLFFPPLGVSEISHKQEQADRAFLEPFSTLTNQELWQKLAQVDSERATAIHPNDRYRVERALVLWHRGEVPSHLAPQFEPPGMCALYFLTRERQELYARINVRTNSMLEQGWLKEVEELSPEWKKFLLTKKLIGYPEIIKFLEAAPPHNSLGYKQAYTALAESIKQSTRAYAKRQLTYWRMLEKKLEDHDPNALFIKRRVEICLTGSSLDVYIEKVSSELDELIGIQRRNSNV